jgi:hypothetical protein
MLALLFSSSKLRALIEAQSVGEREHSARSGWHFCQPAIARLALPNIQ